jgi:hypothetical protein
VRHNELFNALRLWLRAGLRRKEGSFVKTLYG